jgi:hypothetical protein
MAISIRRVSVLDGEVARLFIKEAKGNEKKTRFFQIFRKRNCCV